MKCHEETEQDRVEKDRKPDAGQAGVIPETALDMNPLPDLDEVAAGEQEVPGKAGLVLVADGSSFHRAILRPEGQTVGRKVILWSNGLTR